MSSACGDESSVEVAGSGVGGEIMLFGVRVKVDPMRKSVSLNNLSQYEQPNNNNDKVVDEGYVSADDVVHHQSNSGRERKRGVPWTEEEHKLFLLGLQKVGKGDWRGISRNFVKTRTPTQVASHAQKYFLRRSNLNRRRRRSSLFDITTDSVAVIEEEGKKKPTTLPISETSKTNVFPMAVAVGPMVLPTQREKPIESSVFAQRDQGICFPAVPDLNIYHNSTVEPSLRLSLSLDHGQASSTAFKPMSSFSNGESIISVS